MVNNKLIKVCGMCEGENIREVESPDIDMIGFIFYPKSPRYLCEMPDYMPANDRRVGVFVNEDKQTIEMPTVSVWTSFNYTEMNRRNIAGHSSCQD